MSLQQVFLRKTKELSKYISTLDPGKALELGVGDGAITNLLLDANWIVHGWELDANLTVPQHPHLKMTIGDFTNGTFDYLADGTWSLISAPPYNQLDFVFDLIQRNNLPYLLMLPERCLDKFCGDVVLTLNGATDFEPPSKGIHYMVSHRMKLKLTI